MGRKIVTTTTTVEEYVGADGKTHKRTVTERHTQRGAATERGKKDKDGNDPPPRGGGGGGPMFCCCVVQ